MEPKIFIDANTLLTDSFMLARKVYESGYRPDFLLGVWRGGTPPGIAIHEFLVFKKASPKYHTAIKAESYSGIGQRCDNVIIENLDKVASMLNEGDRILIVDDIFDTGKSMEAIKHCLYKAVKFHTQIKVATVYYKPDNNLTDFMPDYYLKTVKGWVVFPHELNGLSMEELRKKGQGICGILMV
ncbi:hypoxanthine phosphoribosyltransferase [bacterium]|nr:hypoxanthine phosphoribosyltransferase [bacterium]